MDQVTEQIEKIIFAVEMEPGQVYITAQSTNQIKIRLKEKKDGVVYVEAYSPNHKKWLVTKVEETYRVRIPGKEEIKMENNEATTATQEKKSGVKNKGLVSGLKMLAAWGKHFAELGREENGRQLVIDAMLADFPHKETSIMRWVDAYRVYFNTGRLPGQSKPETPILWPTPAKEAREAEKRANAEKRAAEKEIKQAAKLAEREKKAQRRAEQAAAKEATRAEAAAQPKG